MGRLVLILVGAALGAAAVAVPGCLGGRSTDQASVGRSAADRTGSPDGRPVYRSPLCVAFSPDGEMVAVSDRTGGELVLIGVEDGRVVRRIGLRGEPAGVAWSADGRRVYVSEWGAGTVAEVDAAGGAVLRRLDVGPRPAGLAVCGGRGRLVVAESALNAVHVIDLATGREEARIQAVREPFLLAVSPDERLAVVGNRLPAGDASRPLATAEVSLIDLDGRWRAADVPLLANSTNVHGVAISRDCRWACIAHNVGRTALPTIQIEHGWIIANAVTIIDLASRQRHATVLLDQAELGAADPWGLAISPDGATLWAALSGVHQVGRLDLAAVHAFLKGSFLWISRGHLPGVSDEGAAYAEHILSSQAPGRDDPHRVELALSHKPIAYGMGVYVPGVFRRLDLPGQGPRGVALSPDGSRLAVALYYAGAVAVVDARTGGVDRVVNLGPQPPEDDVRRGEKVFHDATRCYQHWLSCATCHPDGRADGLNWDLINDGIGNPKNTLSLLLSHRTPPAMAHGVRADMEAAAAAGFRFILFRPAAPADLAAAEAYIRSLRLAGSPYRIRGELSARARRGKAIFEDPRTGCLRCHPPPLYTDLGMHDVGTPVESDDPRRDFDTPTLIELWRTAPYLHHGKAAAVRDVLRGFNRDDKHGKTSHLSGEDIDALAEYLLSL